MIKRIVSNTCLLAVKGPNGKAYLAGDRRASWGFSQAQALPKPKVSKRNNTLLAGTGDSFLCTLIVDIMQFEPFPDDGEIDLDSYINHYIYQCTHDTLRVHGLADKDGSLKIPGDLSAEILMIVERHLYSIQIFNPDPISEAPNGIIAIDELSFPYGTGCGGQWAWGAYQALDKCVIMPIKNKIRQAMEVAANNSPGCDNNIDIVSL